MDALARTNENGETIMGKVKDLTGQSFGRLTVVKQIGFGNKNKHGSRYAKADMDGCTYHDVLISGLTKTGRHVDITDMLKGALE